MRPHPEHAGITIGSFAPVTASEPRDCQPCVLYRAPDLYPVVGWRSITRDETVWLLEQGGAEDRVTREYPKIGDGDWSPTHYARIYYTGVSDETTP